MDARRYPKESWRMTSTHEQLKSDPHVTPGKRTGGTVLTPKGELKLRTQLGYLHTQLRVDFSARLREARAYGAGDMNADYLQIKEEKAVVVAAIKRIENLLADAEIVNHEVHAGDLVTLGATVQVEDLDSERIHSYELVGDFEDVPDGVSIS